VSAVVLVHGLSGSSRWWRRLMRELEPAFDLHPVDVPKTRTLAEAADWLAGWIEAEVERAAVVGHSRGGLVAAKLAAAKPDLVERLALIAPAGGEIASTRRAHVLPLVRTVARAHPHVLVNVARDALRSGPLELWRASGEVTGATVDELGAVRVPTLIVWGERDRLLPPSRAEAFRALIPDARLVVLPKVGHVPMLEAPREVAAVLADFLS
jgi:pimeloyl-ACP methyl ester carboxylesterase